MMGIHDEAGSASGQDDAVPDDLHVALTSSALYLSRCKHAAKEQSKGRWIEIIFVVHFLCVLHQSSLLDFAEVLLQNLTIVAEGLKRINDHLLQPRLIL